MRRQVFCIRLPDGRWHKGGITGPTDNLEHAQLFLSRRGARYFLADRPWMEGAKVVPFDLVPACTYRGALTECHDISCPVHK